MERLEHGGVTLLLGINQDTMRLGEHALYFTSHIVSSHYYTCRMTDENGSTSDNVHIEETELIN